jgi:hypothetical protein
VTPAAIRQARRRALLYAAGLTARGSVRVTRSRFDDGSTSGPVSLSSGSFGRVTPATPEQRAGLGRGWAAGWDALGFRFPVSEATAALLLPILLPPGTVLGAARRRVAAGALRSTPHYTAQARRSRSWRTVARVLAVLRALGRPGRQAHAFRDDGPEGCDHTDSVVWSDARDLADAEAYCAQCGAAVDWPPDSEVAATTDPPDMPAPAAGTPAPAPSSRQVPVQTPPEPWQSFGSIMERHGYRRPPRVPDPEPGPTRAPR